MNTAFYVKDIKGNLVPAQFLTNNSGNYVTDPNADNAENQIKIYNASGGIVSNANQNGYLIITYMYSMDQEKSFGNYVASLNNTPAIPSVGLTEAYGTMIAAFAGRDDDADGERVDVDRAENDGGDQDGAADGDPLSTIAFVTAEAERIERAMTKYAPTGRSITHIQRGAISLFFMICFLLLPATAGSIGGTYGRWRSDCGSKCSYQVGFDGLLVRKSQNGCIVVFFEARGNQKDYRMFAGGHLENGDKLVAYEYEDVSEFDGKITNSKFCKVVFRFKNNIAEFDSAESDKSGYCTISSAGTWLTDFRHKKVSESTEIPPNAEAIYRNKSWKKQASASSLPCTNHQLLWKE